MDDSNDNTNQIKCGFARFDDGTSVSAAARKIYRDNQGLQDTFPDPYATRPGNPTYQRWLRANRPGAIDGLCVRHDDLERAFNDLFDADYYMASYPDAAVAIEAGRFGSALERLGISSRH